MPPSCAFDLTFPPKMSSEGGCGVRNQLLLLGMLGL